METFMMSRKEVPRAGLLKAALAGRITNAQGARALRLSVRQFRRLKKRFREGGARGLLHALRGRPGNRQLALQARAQIATLMTTTYAGFNDVHLTEKLREVHELVVSRSSVRNLRRALGRPAKRRRRAPKHRSRRPRKAALGQLAQLDASPFAWFEDRGTAATLHGLIDDATSTPLALWFRPHEDLHGSVAVLDRTCRTYGLPLELYGDRLNVFARNDAHWTLAEELQGHPGPHALRPHAADPRHWLHPGPLASSERPHRTALGHAPRSPHQRIAAARHPHARGRQRLSARVPRALHPSLCAAARGRHPRLAAGAARSRRPLELSVSPHCSPRQHRAPWGALGADSARPSWSLLCQLSRRGP